MQKRKLKHRKNSWKKFELYFRFCINIINTRKDISLIFIMQKFFKLAYRLELLLLFGNFFLRSLSLGCKKVNRANHRIFPFLVDFTLNMLFYSFFIPIFRFLNIRFKWLLRDEFVQCFISLSFPASFYSCDSTLVWPNIKSLSIFFIYVVFVRSNFCL